MNHDGPAAAAGSPLEVLTVFLRLGLTSFGGPVAHLGYFREEFVVRRRWLDDETYADLVALCQFLPGPASSQVGIAIGLSRAGYAGALAAWAGFTLPSAIVLVLFAYGLSAFGDALGGFWLHGLKVAAVAVVALAVLGMLRTLAPDRTRATLAVAAAAIVLVFANIWGQMAALIFGAVAGLLLLRDADGRPRKPRPAIVSRGVALVSLAVFFGLLVALPLVATATDSQPLHLVDAFYRAGSLVFGGGHVVLPLLQAEVVPSGWVGNDAFLAGYGAAQAVPGPLFTFAAFLGAIMNVAPGGLAGAALCLVAIFAPSFLLVIGALPFWDGLRTQPLAQSALKGVNAAVVGLLIAALYDPVFVAGITRAADFALASAAFLLLYLWKTPPWLVVALCAVGATITAAL
ncbi:MAG: putative chromate transport protein [Pseudorhodoplanes sp.]|nr:putative chromate transport protein [Pseudorhodoplanes sp.]